MVFTALYFEMHISVSLSISVRYALLSFVISQNTEKSSNPIYSCCWQKNALFFLKSLSKIFILKTFSNAICFIISLELSWYIDFPKNFAEKQTSRFVTTSKYFHDFFEKFKVEASPNILKHCKVLLEKFVPIEVAVRRYSSK